MHDEFSRVLKIVRFTLEGTVIKYVYGPSYLAIVNPGSLDLSYVTIYVYGS